MRVVTFGEIMLRLKTPQNLRILQADSFEASYGGAEANVAVALAVLGDEVSFVTKLPENPIGQAALNEVRRFGAYTGDIVRGGGRLGTYYFEKGSNIRPTNVVYDRAYSAFAMSDPQDYRWEEILRDAAFFYFSGVTPAVGDSVVQALREALSYCREQGIFVVCDLNYRSKLWDTGKAQAVMRELTQYVDLCIANDEDFESALGIHAYDGDISRGIDQIDSYRAGMREIMRRFPGCRAVASVLRNVHSVEDGQWMGLYLKDGVFYESPVHQVHSLEAVGAGDAFAGALLHGLIHQYDPQRLIDFAIAGSVLKLMIQHDFNLVTEADIERVMRQRDTNLQR